MTELFRADRTGGLIVYGVVAILLAKAVFGYSDALETLAAGNTDDIVRLVSVRALLDGQPWYDMTLYRALPPEGVSLHWSRLLDAAIAVLGAPVRLVFGAEAAERFVLVAWPTLLFLALIVVTWRGVRDILGPMAGRLAVLTLYFWSVIESTYFDIARIDHHNLQILLSTVVFFAAISPGPARRRGLTAGIATALSLAIGLEALVLLAALGVIVAVRGVCGDGALRWYATSLPLAALAFFAAQVAPSDWAVAYCDALAPPVLSLLGLAALAAFASLALPAGPVPRLALAAAVVAAGLVALRPYVGHCLAGPYGLMDADLQRLIASQIAETRSAVTAFGTNPAATLSTFTPVVGGLLLAALAYRRDRRRSRETLCALALGLFTLTLAIVQLRHLVLVAPILPFLIARGLTPLVERATTGSPRDGLLPLLAGLSVTFLAPSIFTAAVPLVQGDPPEPFVLQDADCRDPSNLRALEALAPGKILASINLGPALLLLTPHDVLAVPYHRSADALRTGFTGLSRSETGLRDLIRETGADYLLVCDGSRYGDGYATALAAGEAAPDWLEPVELEAGALRPFAVRR